MIRNEIIKFVVEASSIEEIVEKLVEEHGGYPDVWQNALTAVACKAIAYCAQEIMIHHESHDEMRESALYFYERSTEELKHD